MQYVQDTTRKALNQGPCPHCSSSDAWTEYDNGFFCFSCRKSEMKKVDYLKIVKPENTEITPTRGILERSLRFYGVETEYVNGEPSRTIFVYPNGAQKLRGFKEKTFSVQGPMAKAGLFGKDKFDPGSKESVVVTEGEYDAIAVYQICNGKSACVSVQSSSTAKRDCINDFDYLNSFDKIILAFDNDGPGREAKAKVASLFDPKKLLVMKFTKYKDANEYLINNEGEELYSLWNNASKETPDGIIHSFSDVEKSLTEHKQHKLASYPFECLENSLFGLHKGELVLFKGMEGIGKTEIFRAMEYHALKTTEENIGIIRLEETLGDTIRGLATYHLQAPAMMDDSGVSNEDVVNAYKEIVKGKQDRLYIQSGFDSDDPDVILGNIRFLVSGCDCRIIFLDHLSMLVTGLEDDDERKKLDYVVTQLKKMAIKLGFCLVTIMHVNDNGQTRSSRYPPKIANTVIHMERNIRHPDPFERKKLSFIVEKGRGQGAKTGPVGSVFYDNESTYTLQELKNGGNADEDTVEGIY